ncbi:MAG: plasmid stabilization protein [Synechococcaceae bacterium WB8_1B_136]|nr:plasmid stabilization protein [Synechococcaceae bacterium WB8_1B_136]
MATLTIRNLDEQVKRQLRLRAARHGRSMEEEARAILGETVNNEAGSAAETPGLGTRIHLHFAPLGGVDLELPQRASLAEAATFSQPPA